MLEIRLLASRIKEEWIKQYLGLLKNIKKKLYSIWYSNICSPDQGLHLFLNNSIFFLPTFRGIERIVNVHEVANEAQSSARIPQ